MNAPGLLVIPMTMVMRRYGAKHIDQCVMLSASVETGHRYWSSIFSVSVFPQQPPVA
jgi:hypothetical protein